MSAENRRLIERPYFTVSFGGGPLPDREYLMEHPTRPQLVKGWDGATRYPTYEDARHAADGAEAALNMRGYVVEHN